MIVGLVATIAFLLMVIFVTGDLGLTNYLISAAEVRAFKNKNTAADKIGLRLLYNGMIISSRFQLPLASKCLNHYCYNNGDTLYFDPKPLLVNKEVQKAILSRKKGIVFKSGPEVNKNFHFVKTTDKDLYFAFDVLHIRQTKHKIIFYDTYYFQPLERRTRPLFEIGKIKFRLNDGLIKVAYPEAKPFVAYAEVNK
ncbi:MAG: hypothetical protein EOO43_10680 [Flavobacterium sp.]|nr:MAG: hypothetical protein EOO43_10680 [Flavobacterium sp.]